VATDLPVNADFEEITPSNCPVVILAVETGVAGFSIEDYNGRHLYVISEATERIVAARKAIDSSGANVLLVGRAEGLSEAILILTIR